MFLLLILSIFSTDRFGHGPAMPLWGRPGVLPAMLKLHAERLLKPIAFWFKGVVMESGARRRKPFGEGRAALQRKLRQCKAHEVADWILPHLDVEAVESTGHLFPRGPWRKRRVKAVFEPWIYECKGSRMFTSRLCQAVVRRLCVVLQTIPPRHPRQQFSEWVGQQGRRLKELVRAAKKHGGGSRRMASRDPSEFDTQLEDRPSG